MLAQGLPIFEAGRDSGLFLYIGEKLLTGQIPYRDIWDHKGPVIYFIDALGLTLGGGSRWGLWAIELACLYLSALLSHTILLKRYGYGPALITTLAWLCSIPLVLEGGNFTEEFALPLQFLALYIYLTLDGGNTKSRASILHLSAIGVLAALTFFLRPNNIGIFIAIAISILAVGVEGRQPGRAVLELGQMLIGFALVAIPLVIYLALNDALFDFVDAAFLYNAVYASSSFEDRLLGSFAGFLALGPTGLSLLALGGWLGAMFETLRWGRFQQLTSDRTLSVGLVAFPLEVVLSSLSGRTFAHYYLPWIAASSLLVGWLIHRIGTFGQQSTTPPTQAVPSRRYMAFGIVLLVVILSQVYFTMIRLPWEQTARTAGIVRELKPMLGNGTSLLVWGAEAEIHNLTRVPSPGRFVYQYPLFTCGYAKPEHIAEFIDNLATAKPLILDTSSTNPNISPLDPQARKNWVPNNKSCPSPELETLYSYVNTNYECTKTFENGWRICAPRQAADR